MHPYFIRAEFNRAGRHIVRPKIEGAAHSDSAGFFTSKRYMSRMTRPSMRSLPSRVMKSLSETMSGSAIGMDFLGDAINHGSKIGDFKDNDDGLIASKAFVDWLKNETGVDPAAAYWRDTQIGALKVELFRVEPG